MYDVCVVSLDVFRYDNEFLENEEKYKSIKEGMYHVVSRVLGVASGCG